MSLNGFDSNRHSFVQQNAMEFLQKLPGKELFDLVVVDPPTYSNSKRSALDWDVQRDHVALLNEVIVRLSSKGVIYFSTNYRRFKFDPAAIPNVKIVEISKQTVPEDFRNRRIHRCWFMEKN